jgi:hypothetical protein
MNTITIALPLAALVLAVAPLRSPEPAQSGSGSTAQDLEKKAREALGGVVDEEARELADKVRGKAGESGVTAGPDDAEEQDDAGAAGEGEDEEEAGDPMFARLTRIEERLASIEGMLCDLSARSVPCSATVPGAIAATSSAIASTPAPVAAPLAAAGTPVAAGFVKARVRTWVHGRDVTVKLTLNGMPVGRFDTDTTLDLEPFLQPGRMNQLAIAIDPRGKPDSGGIEVWVDAQMPGKEEYVAILQFKSTKERLADTLDIPWAPRQ